MTDLVIIFNPHIDRTYIEKTIKDYWIGANLDYRGESISTPYHFWECRIIQNGIWKGYASIIESDGDSGFYKFPRSMEHAPCLYFRIDDTDSYRPTDEDINHLLAWPRTLIQSKARENIRYLSIDDVYEFYRSFDEFSNALLSMKIYTKYEESDGYSAEWNPEMPMPKSYCEQKEEFKIIAKEFLKSKIVKDYFFVEHVEDGLFFVQNQMAIREGLKDNNKHPEMFSLIESFIYFEQFDWAK